MTPLLATQPGPVVDSLQSGLERDGRRPCGFRYFIPPTRMPTSKKETHKPVATFRLKGVQASLFTNTSENGVPFHKVTVTRSYRDGDTWKSTSSFSRDDLPLVWTVVQQAWREILERESTQRPTEEAA